LHPTRVLSARVPARGDELQSRAGGEAAGAAAVGLFLAAPRASRRERALRLPGARLSRRSRRAMERRRIARALYERRRTNARGRSRDARAPIRRALPPLRTDPPAPRVRHG